MNPLGPDGITHGGPASPLFQIRLGFGVHLVCQSGGSRGRTGVPVGNLGPARAECFGRVEVWRAYQMVTPRKSSRQAAEMQQAQRPGLSGSGFASTGPGEGEGAPT